MTCACRDSRQCTAHGRHALAGLYSCKIQSFDGYIQSLNPNLTYALIHCTFTDSLL